MFSSSFIKLWGRVLLSRTGVRVHEQKLFSVTVCKIYHIANTLCWRVLWRVAKQFLRGQSGDVFLMETASCLTFFPVGRIKLRSSGVFGRRAFSCFVIGRFGPASWQLHGRGKYLAKAWEWLQGRSNTVARDVVWIGPPVLMQNLHVPWAIACPCLSHGLPYLYWLFSLSLESCIALELRVMRPAISVSL